MYLIFGIGNPGSRYKYNRHNAGFLLLDYFAEKSDLRFKEAKGDYLKAEQHKLSSNFTLIKPTTFVNNTGLAVAQALESYGTGIENCLVICDDINLEVGTIRIRKAGGDGGHNGLASIIYHLGSNNFSRLRIGINNKSFSGNLSEFVLTDFESDEFKILNEIFKSSTILIEHFISGGMSNMLRAYSQQSKDSTDEFLKEE